MNIHLLFFCFVSALTGGNMGLVSAKFIFTAVEKENGAIDCYFSRHGNRKFFCKNKCAAEDILIETDGTTAKSGRYSLRYRDRTSGTSVLSVTVTNITQSDAGLYRCGLGKDLVPESIWDFEFRIADVPLSGYRPVRTDTEGENITIGCNVNTKARWKFLCRDECTKEEDVIIETEEDVAHSGRFSLKHRANSSFGVDMTITNASRSDTGQYTCGSGKARSPDSQRRFRILVISGVKPSKAGEVPVNSVTIIIIIIIIIIVVGLTGLVICIKRNNRANGLSSRGNSDDTNMQCVADGNCPSVSRTEESIYQNLSPVTRDQDQTYSTLKP